MSHTESSEEEEPRHDSKSKKKQKSLKKGTKEEGEHKKKKKAKKAETPTALISYVGSGVPQEVLDMPVDPNEPTYCTCQQVSYGEMIGCDNQDCPIEWFHFGCMDLSHKPKGKWYCPKCLPMFKKKGR